MEAGGHRDSLLMFNPTVREGASFPSSDRKPERARKERGMAQRVLASAISGGLFLALSVIVLTAVGAQDTDREDMEGRIFALTNQERAKKGIPALASDTRLQRAAHKYAGVMAAHNTMGHFVGGTTPAQRIEAEGYAWSAYGENVAYGYTSAESVVQGWMGSPGHRQNILNGRFVHLGVGVARSSRGTLYFCQDFGRPRSRAFAEKEIREGRGTSSLFEDREDVGGAGDGGPKGEAREKRGASSTVEERPRR